MNPANAWLLLTTRSIGVELTGRGHGGLSAADVARALKGLRRGPFLLGMAILAGDESVKEELTRYVHIEIVVDLAIQFEWQSERGDQMWRRLAALAVFESLNGDRCLSCKGKGTRSREILSPEADGSWEQVANRAEQQAKLDRALQRLRRAQWLMKHYLDDLGNMEECGYRPTNRYLLSLRGVRRVIEGLERETGLRDQVIKCDVCRGSGKFKIGELHRAWGAGISRKNWYRIWTGRYAVIQGELDRWRSECLSHVRRLIEGGEERFDGG